ncbi:MAG: molybdopterin-guanine dinucleotide biosynthesis protein B [Oscillospiraceae bacterium]|nr:molybdopterin-guanine dinucleotide biosynthesis protein B [Oscillospiraceae bacterium]
MNANIKAGTRAISVGILAGGKSSRMGKNKALLRIENCTVIERIVKELGAYPEILVSAARKGEYEFLGLPVVYDEQNDTGPIEGLRRVLTEAKNKYVFVCAADMPFIRKELVEYISQFICSDYDCYVITDDEHMQPLCAIYSKAVLPVIEKLMAEGKYRLREIFRACPTKYIPLEYSCFDKKVVRNINTKEEYLEIKKPVVFCVSGFSDSGKTWLISRLINGFISEGYSCAVLKHDGHDVFSDLPESDTDIFRRSGACCCAVFSDTRYSVHYSETIDPEGFVGKMRELKVPPDVVIIEGLKNSAYPKVEIIRKNICDKSVCDKNTLICAVSDCISPEEVNCPVYGLDDIRSIFMRIKEYFCLETI